MGGVATYYQSLLNSSLPARVDLHFVQTSSRKRVLAQTGSFSLANLVWAAEDCLRFAKAVIKHRPQVSHIATAFGLSFVKHSVCVLIARLAGSRVLLHHHCGLAPLYTDRSRGWRWYFRQVIRLTNGVIALSKEWLQLAEIVPGCKVYELPNAIDLSQYRPIASQRIAPVGGPSQVNILCLGYLGRNKGTYELIESARVLRERGLPVSFDLVGEELATGEGELLKQEIARTGLEGIVRLHPPVGGEEKNAYLRKADIFAQPSYSEGMPIAIIEAMACGLPIVASRVGGIPDQVSEGVNGFLVDARRADQLAQALEKLVSDPGLRAGMQANSARLAVEKFDVEVLVPRLVKIYQEALGQA
jgi:glycosyltransferase involved in cell wall biosynthesis